ncbi:hypothetical protein SAMN05192534_102135 [Alteribacillus persepolensis]|uniref:Uncharacterized protein n=1 Tax=Alteribacillus persepolensis TaxID=568899 RepID=A0A1G8AF72_9BACI|nr:hypothetical protein SAMN05192534_102135 [Alteribacillus persepolensis]
MPEHAFKVKFDVEPGSITFDADRAEVNIDVQPHKPDIHAPRWEVQHYMRQKPSISFHISGEQVNRTL